MEALVVGTIKMSVAERKERKAGWTHMKFAQCGTGKEE